MDKVISNKRTYLSPNALSFFAQLEQKINFFFFQIKDEKENCFSEKEKKRKKRKKKKEEFWALSSGQDKTPLLSISLLDIEPLKSHRFSIKLDQTED